MIASGPIHPALPVLALPDGRRLLQGVDTEACRLKSLMPVRCRSNDRHAAFRHSQLTNAMQESKPVNGRPAITGNRCDLGEHATRLGLEGLVSECGNPVSPVGMVTHDPLESNNSSVARRDSPVGGNLDRKRLKGHVNPVATLWRREHSTSLRAPAHQASGCRRFSPAWDDEGMTESNQLDELDQELLNAVQWDFPLTPRPYAALGERIGISEAEVMTRVTDVKRKGVLRQLSAIFDTRALGYSSSLIAAKVDPARIDAAAAIISTHPGVSHNYKRNHDYNLWYTIAVPPGESLQSHVDMLHDQSGSLVTRVLPTLKLFKIGVKLDMTGKTAADAKVEILEHERPERRPDMAAPELSDSDIATIRVVQEDLPIVERPFAATGELIGIDEQSVLDALASLKERKLMRRFAAVMNHKNAGYKANVMGVWAVPEDRIEDLGPEMAGFAAVSHCYRRPTYEDWPYTVFTMIHGQSARDCEATVAAIESDTGITEHCMLWSVKEYKKTRVRYFTDDWDGWLGEHTPAAAVLSASDK